MKIVIVTTVVVTLWGDFLQNFFTLNVNGLPILF